MKLKTLTRAAKWRRELASEWQRMSHQSFGSRYSKQQQLTSVLCICYRSILILPYSPLSTPVTTENNIRRELPKNFDLFARRMRLQYIYCGKEREPHPFHMKSHWNPPVQPSFRGFRNLSRGSEIRVRRESI